MIHSRYLLLFDMEMKQRELWHSIADMCQFSKKEDLLICTLVKISAEVWSLPVADCGVAT